MWYPPQQQQYQQQRWHGYNRHLSAQPAQQQQSYSRTSYYCATDESLTPNRTTSTTYVVSRNDENESFHHYHSTRADDVYGIGPDHYVTTSTSTYSDEMSSSSLPYQSPNTHWNPIIAAPTKPSSPANSISPNHLTHTTPSSPSSPSAACWDWLLYAPEVYSHLYRPSLSFTQQPARDEDVDLLASLPSWLLVLLYPSLKSTYATDDENDSDQEITSLHNRSDEPSLSMNIDNKITHVSSNLSLSSANALNEQKLPQKRSSTPDTDDGYQSASDASRSDYSQQSSVPYEHHPCKDEIAINVSSSPMPRRISYAAAAKPLPAPIMTNKTSALSTPIIKTKNTSSLLTAHELLSTTGQKLKFIAPRFERMHHAKQYPSPTGTMTTTTANKDSPSSSSLCFSNRTSARSNPNHHQRNPLPHSTRRR